MSSNLFSYKIGPIHVHQVNVLTLSCANVLSSRNSLGILFQALAAENSDEVWPHLVLTRSRSKNVGSLRDRQCLCDRFTN